MTGVQALELALEAAVTEIQKLEATIALMDLDVERFREMTQRLLSELHSEHQQVLRLMYRIEQASGRSQRS